MIYCNIYCRKLADIFCLYFKLFNKCDYIVIKGLINTEQKSHINQYKNDKPWIKCITENRAMQCIAKISKWPFIEFRLFDFKNIITYPKELEYFASWYARIEICHTYFSYVYTYIYLRSNLDHFSNMLQINNLTWIWVSDVIEKRPYIN